MNESVIDDIRRTLLPRPFAVASIPEVANIRMMIDRDLAGMWGPGYILTDRATQYEDGNFLLNIKFAIQKMNR